jgi:hypothetical protein
VYEEGSVKIRVVPPLSGYWYYQGKLVSFQAVLDIGPSTLVYGSADGGRSFANSDLRVQHLVKLLCEKLNFTELPFDFEIHACRFDPNSFFCVDVARVGIPQSPLAHNRERDFPLWNFLRPELVECWPEPLVPDSYTMRAKPELRRKLKQVADMLLTQIIPEFAKRFGRDDRSVPLKGLMHAAGINMRFLPLVYQHVDEEAVERRALLRREMFCIALRKGLKKEIVESGFDGIARVFNDMVLENNFSLLEESLGLYFDRVGANRGGFVFPADIFNSNSTYCTLLMNSIVGSGLVLVGGPLRLLPLHQVRESYDFEPFAAADFECFGKTRSSFHATMFFQCMNSIIAPSVEKEGVFQGHRIYSRTQCLAFSETVAWRFKLVDNVVVPDPIRLNHSKDITHVVSFSDGVANFWSDKVGEKTKEALGFYNDPDSSYGKQIRGLRLHNATLEEIDQTLLERGFEKIVTVILTPFNNAPLLDAQGCTIPMWIYRHSDGSVVRVKPNGDSTSKYRPLPTVVKACVYPPDCKTLTFDDEVFKVSKTSDTAIPKHASDLQNIFQVGSREASVYETDWAETAHGSVKEVE